MLRSIRLLFQKFTPVEIAVLDSVIAALPAEASAICREQVAAITKVQRYLEWAEINFYRIINGTPDWKGVRLFREHGEFTLSKSTYTIGNRKFATQIICVGGHIFSFVTRPSIKRYCFCAPNNLQTIVLAEPTQASTEPPRSLPRTFTDWHFASESESNGWSALPSAEAYTVHLADADYVVLAARGDEFLLSQIDDKAEMIYYAATADAPRAVGTSFADAMAET